MNMLNAKINLNNINHQTLEAVHTHTHTHFMSTK